MAVSLEARVPILDHKVCEFAYNLPATLKIRNNTKKYLLKKVASKLLPHDFPLERKQGFSVPLREWMQGELGNMCMDLLKSNRLSSDLISLSYVEKLYHAHRTGREDNSQRLWAVLMFSTWCNKFYS